MEVKQRAHQIVCNILEWVGSSRVCSRRVGSLISSFNGSTSPRPLSLFTSTICILGAFDLHYIANVVDETMTTFQTLWLLAMPISALIFGLVDLYIIDRNAKENTRERH